MLKVKENIQVIIINDRLNYALIFAIVALVLFYAYFANMTVRIVAVLQNIKSDTQELRMQVAELEAKYLALEGSINLKTATDLGLEENLKPVFIVKGVNGKILSLR